MEFGPQLPSIASDTQRPIEQYTSFARVAYWHFQTQFVPMSSNMSKSIDDTSSVVLGVIESEIESVKVDKDINTAAGTFEITVLPSKNWKGEISPGDWLIIQLFSGKEKFVPPTVMNQNVVLFGNVDRVSRSKQRDENSDKTLVRYIISGRDFGKVFEDTDIFFDPRCVSLQNPLTIQTWLTARGIPFSDSPSVLVRKVFEVFSGITSLAQAMDGGGTDIATNMVPLRQWMLPMKVFSFFQPLPMESASAAAAVPAFGAMCATDFVDLPGFTARMSIDSGDSLWSVMQRMSNPVVNEMFCDLRRDGFGRVRPTLVLRSRPASPVFDKTSMADPVSASLLDGKWKTLSQLVKVGVVDIQDSEARFENLGRDHQTMFNMLWLQSQHMGTAAGAWASTDAPSGPTIGNPMFCNELIRRYGLRKLEQQMDFVYLKEGKQVNHEIQMLKGFLMQRYDQVAYNHLYETGTIETVGKLEAELGKVLRLYPPANSDVLMPSPKLYYIEGYTHEYKYPGLWTTTWRVTNGVFDNPINPFIDSNLMSSDWGSLVAGTVEIRGGTTPVKAGI